MASLTEEQIEFGFWHFRPGSRWSKENICHTERYDGGETLSFACTQGVGSSSYARQKKLIKQWCEFLPSLTKVKFLLFTTQMNQEIFEAITRMEHLEGLWIKWSSIKNISSITRLYNLKHLHIGSSTRIQDVSHLGTMTQLVTLELENIRVLNSLSVISALSQLEGLGISGSNWTLQKVESLIPLQSLTRLRYITLWGTKILDQSLKPLATLKNLNRIDTAQFYAQEEYQYLVKNLPKLKYGNAITEALKNADNS